MVSNKNGAAIGVKYKSHFLITRLKGIARDAIFSTFGQSSSIKFSLIIATFLPKHTFSSTLHLKVLLDSYISCLKVLSNVKLMKMFALGAQLL